MPQKKKSDWDRLKTAFPKLYLHLRDGDRPINGEAAFDDCRTGKLAEQHSKELALARKRAEQVIDGVRHYDLENPLFVNGNSSSERSWLAFPFDAAVKLLEVAFCDLPNSTQSERALLTLLHDNLRCEIYRLAGSFEDERLLEFFVYLALCRYEKAGDAEGSGQIAKRYNLGPGLRQHYGAFGGYADGSDKPSQRAFGGPVLVLELTCALFDRHWKDARKLGLQPFWDQQSFLECRDLAIDFEKGDLGSLAGLPGRHDFAASRQLEDLMAYPSALTSRRALSHGRHRTPPLKYREPVAIALDLVAAPPGSAALSPQNALRVVREGCARGWRVSSAFLEKLSGDALRLYTFAACILTGRFDVTRTDGYLVKLFGSKGAPRTGDYRVETHGLDDSKIERHVRAFLFGRDEGPYRLALAKGPTEVLRVEHPDSDSPAISGAFQEPTGDDTLWVTPELAAFRPCGEPVDRVSLRTGDQTVQVGPYCVIPLVVEADDSHPFGPWKNLTDDLRTGFSEPVNILGDLPAEDDFTVTFTCRHPLKNPSAVIAEGARHKHIYVEDGNCTRGGFTLSRSRKGAVTIKRAGSPDDGDVLLSQGSDWYLVDDAGMEITNLTEFTVVILRLANPQKGLHTFHFRLPATALSVAEHRLAKLQSETAKVRRAAQKEERHLHEVRDSLYQSRDNLINRCDWYPTPYNHS